MREKKVTLTENFLKKPFGAGTVYQMYVKIRSKVYESFHEKKTENSIAHLRVP